jgi:PAS domain S-box-containing protein
VKQFVRTNRFLAAGFLIALVGVGLNALLSYRTAQGLIDTESAVAHTQEVRGAAETVLLAVVDAETGQRGYLLTGRESFLRPFDDARGRINQALAGLRERVADSPAQTARVKELDAGIRAKLATMAAGVAERQAGRPLDPAVLEQGKQEMDAIREVARAVQAEETRLLAERSADAARGRWLADVTFAVATFLAVATVAAAFALLVRDQNARRRAEAVVAQEREELRTLADAMPQIVWVARPDGHHEYYNRRWYQFTGVPAGATDGDGWAGLFHPDDRPAARAKWVRSLATGEPYEVEYRLRRHDGQFRWQLGRALPARGPDGAVRRWYGTCTDIHDAKRVEQQFAEAKQVAEAANQAKSAFLANMSHELRTPLNAVIMYAELLQEEAEDLGQEEKFGPDLDKIRAAGKHLLSLVNGVLDLSKIEAGKMELDLTTFEVPAMVTEVVDTIRPLVDKKHNRLAVQCPPGVGAVYADLTKVRQVLFNLLSNASKFTKNGTVTLTVARQPGDSVVFAVADTGIGMTPEQVGKLFRPFTQADASTTRKFGGTGLGLTISKRFVEMMGGTLTVASEAGQGTTFTATLPSRVPTPPPPARPSGLLLPPDAPAMLVIDDDPGVRELMTRALASQGVRPLLAADGEEGLRLARAHHPAVIFLDVIMPRLDGWAVLAAVKGDPALKDTPVVMMTIVSDKDMGFMLGAADFLQKPIDREQLAAALAKYAPAAGGRVLVVDDDPGTREVLRRALAKTGWQVDEAENGRLALERVRAGPPALILLDLLMPEMTGFEVVRELRRTPDWQNVPVVVLSSKDLTPDERAMLSGSVERVLQKGTYSRDALMTEINKVVAAYGRDAPTVRPAAVEG